MSDTKVYKKNFLTDVVCIINFASKISIDETIVKELKSGLGAAYGELLSVESPNIFFQDNPETGFHAEKSMVSTWRITSSDNTHRFEIKEDSILLVYSKYHHFDDLREALSNFTSKLFKKLKTKDISIASIGLRYINQISPATTPKIDEWREYINPSLVANLGFLDSSKEDFKRGMQSIVVQPKGSDFMIECTFGLYNPLFPANPIRDKFILDFNAHTNNAFEVQEIDEYVEGFNEAITEYFERAITDKLREELENEDE